MLNKLYDLLNAMSVTAWIAVIYVFKEGCKYGGKVHYLITGVILTVATIGAGALSLFLTKFLSEDNLEKCEDVEQADATFLPAYIGYFLVAFSISNIHQLLVATVCLTVFLFLVRWQYFNVTYLFFGYHCYHISTSTHTKVFLICRKEIRTPDHVQFKSLRRISNTTYIERR